MSERFASWLPLVERARDGQRAQAGPPPPVQACRNHFLPYSWAHLYDSLAQVPTNCVPPELLPWHGIRGWCATRDLARDGHGLKVPRV